jgi:dTDP-4-amino-4,6-dideoxygalactose transaminase
LEAAGIGPGDQVITTPYTFTATAEVIRYLGADTVFVDIDPNTFNIDASKIEEYLTQNLELRTKNSARVVGLVPVHFAGYAIISARVSDTKG